MSNDDDIAQDVLEFIRDQIDSVPHLEALLLFWDQRVRVWSLEEMAACLYILPDTAAVLLEDLARRGLIRTIHTNFPGFAYNCGWDTSGDLMMRVAQTYRSRLVRVATLIHSKGTQATRDFAQAFVLKKDK